MRLLFILLCSTWASSQTFITLDEDTNELVENVNYSVFKNRKQVFSGTTLSDNPTTINLADYDSIHFKRVDYEAAGFRKAMLDSVVYLKKKSFAIDEVAVADRRGKQIVLGETNRFVKNHARPFSREVSYGSLFRNETDANLLISKVELYVANVKCVTRYRIDFYNIEESKPIKGRQSLWPSEPFFSTDTLRLPRGTKGKVEVDITPTYLLLANEKVFVTVQLIDYLDANDKTITPKFDDMTKLSFQLSDKADFYSKLADYHTKELTFDLKNINLMIHYDFANHFFKKPHKSIIVAPAVVLLAAKE